MSELLENIDDAFVVNFQPSIPHLKKKYWRFAFGLSKLTTAKKKH